MRGGNSPIPRTKGPSGDAAIIKIHSVESGALEAVTLLEDTELNDGAVGK